MAAYRVVFRFRGKQLKFLLGPVARDEAESTASKVDYLLMRLKQGLIQLPDDGDIIEFVRNDGHLSPAALKSSSAGRRRTQLASPDSIVLCPKLRIVLQIFVRQFLDRAAFTKDMHELAEMDLHALQRGRFQRPVMD